MTTDPDVFILKQLANSCNHKWEYAKTVNGIDSWECLTCGTFTTSDPT